MTVEWKKDDLIAGFSLDPKKISDLLYLENGMIIAGQPAAVQKGPNLKLKYPLQLQQYNLSQEAGGSRLMFAPIVGCGPVFEIRQHGITAHSPLTQDLLNMYCYQATMHHGLKDGVLERLAEEHRASREAAAAKALEKYATPEEQKALETAANAADEVQATDSAAICCETTNRDEIRCETTDSAANTDGPVPACDCPRHNHD